MNFEKPYKPKSGYNLLGLFVTIILFSLAVIFLTIAYQARDWMWWLSGFQQEPALVTVYQDGKKTEYRQGQPGYSELAEGVRDSLNSGVARMSGVGLSGGSLEDAYAQGLTVEAFFESPAKLHAYFNTGDPTQMLFPIIGRHSELKVVFLAENGRYFVNAPALKDVSPLRKALLSLGYLKSDS
jgi:hypothetical protein